MELQNLESMTSSKAGPTKNIDALTPQQASRDELAHIGWVGGMVIIGLCGVAFYLLDKHGSSK